MKNLIPKDISDDIMSNTQSLIKEKNELIAEILDIIITITDLQEKQDQKEERIKEINRLLVTSNQIESLMKKLSTIRERLPEDRLLLSSRIKNTINNLFGNINNFNSLEELFIILKNLDYIFEECKEDPQIALIIKNI